MPEKDNDNKLIQNLIKGDSLAFDELFRKYYNKIYSFSYRYLQNKQDAEEVVQEVFITVWKIREKLKEIKNLNSWLFTITFNQIRKIFRNMAIEKRKLETVAMSSVFEEDSVLTEIEFNDLMSKAGEIIERIPKKQKTVLLLSIRDGLSSSEISSKLKINKRTVENHLSNARAYLKKVFNEEHLIPLVILWFLL
jgi:RNA polymerase sigma-70 factor (ECF subfamily)